MKIVYENTSNYIGVNLIVTLSNNLFLPTYFTKLVVWIKNLLNGSNMDLLNIKLHWCEHFCKF